MSKTNIINSSRTVRNGEIIVSLSYNSGGDKAEEYIYKHMGDYWTAFIESGNEANAIEAIKEYSPADFTKVVFVDTPFVP